MRWRGARRKLGSGVDAHDCNLRHGSELRGLVWQPRKFAPSHHERTLPQPRHGRRSAANRQGPREVWPSRCVSAGAVDGRCDDGRGRRRKGPSAGGDVGVGRKPTPSARSRRRTARSCDPWGPVHWDRTRREGGRRRVDGGRRGWRRDDEHGNRRRRCTRFGVDGCGDQRTRGGREVERDAGVAGWRIAGNRRRWGRSRRIRGGCPAGRAGLLCRAQILARRSGSD